MSFFAEFYRVHVLNSGDSPIFVAQAAAALSLLKVLIPTRFHTCCVACRNYLIIISSSPGSSKGTEAGSLRYQ